jgi:hypothetical protein
MPPTRAPQPFNGALAGDWFPARAWRENDLVLQEATVTYTLTPRQNEALAP